MVLADVVRDVGERDVLADRIGVHGDDYRQVTHGARVAPGECGWWCGTPGYDGDDVGVNGSRGARSKR